MKIKLTYNGKEQIIDNVSVGGRFKWEYTTSYGEKKVYYIIVGGKHETSRMTKE